MESRTWPADHSAGRALRALSSSASSSSQLRPGRATPRPAMGPRGSRFGRLNLLTGLSDHESAKIKYWCSKSHNSPRPNHAQASSRSTHARQAKSRAGVRSNHTGPSRQTTPPRLVKPHDVVTSNPTIVSIATRSLDACKVPHTVRHTCGATGRYMAENPHRLVSSNHTM
jgi:hypothetical protein